VAAIVALTPTTALPYVAAIGNPSVIDQFLANDRDTVFD
jgi:hypothetical protein